MKPAAIFALWAFLGWDVGAWAEAFAGIPAFVGILGGVAIGALLAVEVRRRSPPRPSVRPKRPPPPRRSSRRPGSIAQPDAPRIQPPLAAAAVRCGVAA